MRNRGKKRPSQILPITLGVLLTLLGFGGIAVSFNKKIALAVVQRSAPEELLASAPKEEPNRGLPTRLKIPSVKVDANVEYRGLTASGDLDTPTTLADVGWYKQGALPGNKGTAVIDGHVIGQKGEPGAFSDLEKLRIGDRLVITDSTGQDTIFIVRETRTYNQEEHPAEVFESGDGAHLNLITCTGEWDKTQRRFLKRLVVFADRVTY